MHKKLEAELIHLAHQVLKINKDTNISELQNKAREIYENLSVLSFIDDYFVETPEVTDNKQDFLDKVNKLESKPIVDKKPIEVPKKEEKVIVETPELKKEPVKEPEATSTKEETDQLIQQTVQTIKSEAKEIATKIQEKPAEKPVVEEKSPLDEEMKHSIPADVAADMFEKAETFTQKPETENSSLNALFANRKAEIEVEETTKATETTPEPVKQVEKPKVNIAKKQEIPTPKPVATPSNASLNDRISNQKIQVGLNDRIAFVKHLFNFSQEDFNRVLSQLNSFGTEQECKDFIQNQVKPEYQWTDKQEYEDRLMVLIERKFK